jgi:hypothetical protein
MSLDYPFSASPAALSNACVLIKAVGRNNRDNNLCRPLKNNPTFDVFNDVNQDFSLKYSNNKMGINDVINKLLINNTR